MRLHTAIPVLLVLTTFLCACQKTSSQNETDSKAELVTSTASTTAIRIQTGAASVIYGFSKLTGGFDP